MEDREYLQIKEYHQGLLKVASTVRLIQSRRDDVAGLSLSDRLLLQVGDRLISLGQGLKNRTQHYALTEECA